jgi:hypothetical protein
MPSVTSMTPWTATRRRVWAGRPSLGAAGQFERQRALGVAASTSF